MEKNNNNGWIKLYRSLLDWEWWSDRNTRDLFIYCLIAANHDNTRWRGMDIKCGQFVTTLRKLSSETGLSVREIRTALKHLISTHELTCEPANNYTIITICNYVEYQEVKSDTDKPNDKPNDKRATHEQHTSNT